MLAFVVVFVAVVCVFANRNNKEYLAQKELEAAQNAQDLNGIDVSATAAVVTQASKQEQAGAVVKITTTEPISTTEATTLPIISSTAPQSNAGVGSMDNPVIVTDCSFATAVVNRNYRIPSTYDPDLVYVCGSGQRLQREVAVHYEEMFDAAAAEGIYLTPVSGYRSYDTQVELYNNKINQMLNQGYSAEEAPIQAATIVMVPGSSEHNLGYAMDIVSLYESFDQTAEFAWLMENAEDYGFILRYPKGKEDITKVIYEPWHWRYVGVDTARKINASGLTLEEYYGKSAQ
jgi:D-alanyl-D-alanine carboxypeptidase